MEFRSNEIMHGEDAPFYRSLFKSMGYSDHELDHRPLIGIANTWNTCVPGHFNLNQVNEFVKKVFTVQAERQLNLVRSDVVMVLLRDISE